MAIRLSDHFTFSRLLRFTAPSMVMMLFTSIYGVVDGLFISNFAGKTAFAAVNLIMPFTMMLGGVGAMFGTGGSALVSKTLGEGDLERAHRYFTMLIRLMGIVGAAFAGIGIVVLRPVSYLFGATDTMVGDCVLYGRVVLLFLPAQLMQFGFQNFLAAAERPKFGLAVTVAAGLTNIALDALFVAGFGWGIVGAAAATGMSQCVGGLLPLLFFLSRRNDTILRFARTRFELKPLIKACGNGISEMLSSISGSLTGILYNFQLMRYAGEDGVAAYGVVMYAAFVFVAVFVGYSSGSAPIVSYQYGAGNHGEMRNVLRKSLAAMGVGGCIMAVLGFVSSPLLASIFVGYDEGLMALTIRAFRICVFPLLLMGVNIYASSFFTALNNGGVSAAISFLRALVFPVVTILTLPVFFQLDGVWYSLAVGEACTLVVSAAFLLGERRKYQY